MALRFGSPWMAAAGGLGQGVGQGVMFGMELAQQKQAAKRQQTHDMFNVLMQGMKNMPDDPAQGEDYMKSLNTFVQQFFPGQKMPDIPWAKAKPFADRYKKAESEIKAAFPDRPQEWVDQMAAQQLGIKAVEPRMTVNTPWGTYGGLKPGEAARIGVQAGSTQQRLGQQGEQFQQRLGQQGEQFQQRQGQQGQQFQQREGRQAEQFERSQEGKNSEIKIEKRARTLMKDNWEDSVSFKTGTPEEQAIILEKYKDKARGEIKLPGAKGGGGSKSGFKGPGMYNVGGKPTPIKSEEDYQRLMGQ